MGDRCVDSIADESPIKVWSEFYGRVWEAATVCDEKSRGERRGEGEEDGGVVERVEEKKEEGREERRGGEGRKEEGREEERI